MSFKCQKGFGVTNTTLKGIPDSWCTYTEGARTENKFRSKNGKQLGRGGTKKKPRWSMRDRINMAECW